MILETNFLSNQISNSVGTLIHQPYQVSERMKQNAAVLLIADILASNLGTADIKDIRETSVLIAAEFFGVTEATITDKLTRQLNLRIEKYDELLEIAVIYGYKENLRTILRKGITDRYIEGDKYIVNHI